MKIKKKDIGSIITLNLDYKNYRKLLQDFKRLGHNLEAKSNVNKSNYSVVANFVKKPYMNVKGWCSRVIIPDKPITEIIFIDYDNILFRLVEAELLSLQKRHNLTPFYILKTHEELDKNGEAHGNYLAVSLIKKPFFYNLDILEETHCDPAYRQVPKVYHYKTLVLRLGSKGKKSAPEFKCIIGDLKKKYKQEISQAHLEVLEKLYPQVKGKVKYTNLDNNHKLYLTEYMTGSS